MERDGHLHDVRYENEQIINNSLQTIKPLMNQASMQPNEERKTTNIKRTYSFERNENRNGNENGDSQSRIINSNINNNSNMNSGIGNNINMSGSSINKGMISNIKQDNNLQISQENMEEQDQGEGEEEMLMDENEQENEQENENEEAM